MNLISYKPETFLTSEAMIAGYLTDVLADGDHDELLDALNAVVRARGMTSLADATGLSRESLYKELRAGSKPYFDTIRRVFEALGLKLAAVPAK